ncbi:MAG: glycosyltransferase, partial [Pseudomonadota bacterium]
RAEPQDSELHAALRRGELLLSLAAGIAREIAEDYEIVVIDNGSTDGTPDILRALCGEDGLENLQVYVLTKREDIDVAAWAGLENALGDYVALIDPVEDDVAALPKLLEAAHTGVDVVFAQNDQKRPKSVLYGLASRIFSSAAHTFLKIDRDRELPFYRVLSRKTVNYMLRYDAASFSYRWLPA